MSKPLDLETQRPYALDQLTQLQSQIMQSAQGMVVQRARIEKYRQSDLVAARDTYTELEQIRRNLTEQITAAQLFLLEMEEYKLASMAGQLCRGMSGFNLMSTGYKPIYEVLSRFAAAFPTGQKTNAAVVGRLMNNIKLGYYPTDPDNISLMLRGIRFPDGVTTNLLDPCCGCGKALRQLAQGNNCYAYGVELDESRAEEAQTRLHRVGFGSFFYSRISHEAFHLLFLNPPYLSVINESGGRSRREKRFLIESLPTLMYGGLLIYVIPYYRLTADICRILVDNFDDLSVWRFTDSEFKQFKQVAIIRSVVDLKFRTAAFTAEQNLSGFFAAAPRFGKFHRQLTGKVGTGAQDVFGFSENKEHIIARSRELCCKPCFEICCRQCAAPILNPETDLLQNGYCALFEDFTDFAHCMGKLFCVNYCTTHAARLLVCFSSTVCIRIVWVEKSVCMALFSPCVRML
jgi:hypothetical protein